MIPVLAAVVVPDTDKGDKWIRETESVSHDSMSPWQFGEEKEQREARRRFQDARSAIRSIIDQAAQIEQYGDTRNLNELARFFPDELDPRAPGNRALATRTIRTVPVRQQGQVTEEPTSYEAVSRNTGETQQGGGSAGGDNGGDDGNNGKGGNSSSGQGTDPGKTNRQRQNRPARPPRLNRPRLITTSQSSATVSFTVTEDPPRQVQLTLTPAGSEWANESRIDIIEAAVVSPKDQQVSLDKGVVTLIPPSNERVIMRITTNGNLDDLAFKIG